MYFCESSKRVLLVSDSIASNEVLSEFLQETFPKTLELQKALGGVEALEYIENVSFDLMIVQNSLEFRGSEYVNLLINSLMDIPSEKRPKHMLILSMNFVGENEHIKTLPNVNYMCSPWDEEEIIQFLSSLFDIKASAPLSSIDGIKIGLNLIENLIDASWNVLSSFCGVKAIEEKVVIKKTFSPVGELAAVVPIKAKNFNGSMLLSADMDCFKSLASNVLGKKSSDIDVQEAEDVIGEMCNQVFGVAKAKLNEQGHDIARSIPRVIKANEIAATHAISGQCLAVELVTEKGLLFIETIIEDEKNL